MLFQAGDQTFDISSHTDHRFANYGLCLEKKRRRTHGVTICHQLVPNWTTIAGEVSPQKFHAAILATIALVLGFLVGLTHVESAPLPVSLVSAEIKRKEGTAAMKEQAIQYLALDVHQATIVACVRDERGTITMRATVATEARAILSLVRGVGLRVHVVFEEGTQAQWLHDLLERHVERVVVCNVRGKSEVSNKSDRIDAAELSELLRIGSLRTVYHGSSGVLTLKGTSAQVLRVLWKTRSELILRAWQNSRRSRVWRGRTRGRRRGVSSSSAR